MMYELHAIGYLTLRVVLGIWLVAEGLRHFRIGSKKMASFYRPLYPSFVKESLLRIGFIIGYIIELLSGILLIIGLAKPFALFILSPYFILQAVGRSSITPYWDPKHFFVRLIIYFLLTALPLSWDIYSLDFIFNPPTYH
ncbi:MAG: DoxX family membrane protein [Chlorobi bacterium]|nr:DoxX family membrane protein [Chlorobiota bacterium]